MESRNLKVESGKLEATRIDLAVPISAFSLRSMSHHFPAAASPVRSVLVRLYAALGFLIRGYIPSTLQKISIGKIVFLFLTAFTLRRPYVTGNTF
jgi:hypothetical protein